ncbi:MAG: hypothetical protein ACJ78K_00480, partial [Gemmatimonadaceae bacterium]
MLKSSIRRCILISTSAASFVLVGSTPLASQAPAPFDFSIKNIMRGPELYGRQPNDVRWSADSKW